MNPPRCLTRVVLADEHRLFRAGLARLLTGQGFSVVAETDSGSHCLELIQSLQPSLLLLSLNLMDQSGLEVLHSLRQLDQQLPVLALTPNWSQLSYHSLMRAGASAMISKENDAHQLMAAIQAVVSQPAPMRSTRRKERYISLRQMRILRGMTQGQTNQEIAAHLHYSCSTIKAELRELFQTFGTLDRSQLINSAAQQGLVPIMPNPVKIF
ncbi:response regulator transcription factor [bacterium]|nr:response regulator transcription factor [bacterium]